MRFSLDKPKKSHILHTTISESASDESACNWPSVDDSLRNPMKTRVLKINLAQPIKRLLKERAKSTLAAQIGVTSQKLTSMQNDDWEYITRDSIERTADYLGLSVTEVFEFVSVDFWKPIEEARRCTFLRGAEDVKSDETEFRISRYDDEATDVIKGFLRDSLPDLDGTVVAHHGHATDALLKRVKSESCIVIGSPKSNLASEILLSKFFDAVPFDGSQENRRKIPFGFCWPDSAPIVGRSSLTCSPLARKESGNRPGITVEGGIHIVADYKPPEKFRLWQTEKGADCGLVFVANKPFGTNRNVKLIVLAGFSGIGTLASAKALVQDFRYLEQIEDEKCVYGVVEAKYSTAVHSNVRKFSSFRWRYRKGGRWPIAGQKTNSTK